MVNLAVAGEPQLVTRNGKPTVYVVSAESYEKSKRRKRKSLKSLLCNSPCKDLELDIQRDQKDSGRDVDL